MVTEEGAVSALEGMAPDVDDERGGGNCFDNEIVHIDADRVLLAYLDSSGGKAVADAYRRLTEKVDFWYA